MTEQGSNEKLMATGVLERPLSHVTLTPEQFDKLYLQAGMRATPTLRNKLGNPTPIGVISLTIITFALGLQFLGASGASPDSVTIEVGPGYYLGGLMLVLCGIGEFIVGNTFSMILFLTIGAFWLGFAHINDPTMLIASTLSEPATGAPTSAYTGGFGLYLVIWGAMLMTYAIIALRTNVVLVTAVAAISLVVLLVAAAHLCLSQGQLDAAANCLKAAGALCMVVSACGWYLSVVMLLASLAYPFTLPVGDLSHMFESKNGPIEAV